MIKCYKKKLQDANGALSKILGYCKNYDVYDSGDSRHHRSNSVMSEFPETYASIAVAVVWISWCFTLSLSRSLQKHIFIGVSRAFFQIKLFMTVFNLSFFFWCGFLSLIQIFQITEIAKLLVWETKVQRWK